MQDEGGRDRESEKGQGELGNSWFVSACSALAKELKLFNKGRDGIKEEREIKIRCEIRRDGIKEEREIKIRCGKDKENNERVYGFSALVKDRNCSIR